MSEKIATARHIVLDDLPQEAMNPLMNRRYFSGEQLTFASIELKKGCLVPEHQHVNEQIAFVLSGAMEFYMGEEKVVVRQGQALLIPANLPHSAQAIEDTINLDIFAPPRQDWVTGDDSYLRR
jgi:quercetin dioxygenase-like cupin family protein